LQFASFDLADPIFDLAGLRASIQIVTLENLYGLDPSRVDVQTDGASWLLRADGLSWAGQQQRAPGEVLLRAEPDGKGGVRVAIRASAPEPIRCTKLLLRDLPAPLAVVSAGSEREVGSFGELLGYPNRIPAPLLCVRAGRETLGVRAEDARVREKRFALSLEKLGVAAGRGVLELIHEEEAAHFATSIDTPTWCIRRGASEAELEAEHARFAERHLGLVPLRQRSDVPAWALDLALVVTLHGMHWTGRVFLDYDAMLDALRFVCARVEPGRVLAYLPGWEGRYYWQYGDYRPDPLLGGEAGFARLCTGARALGCHLMPMFGGNCVNTLLPRWRERDPALHLKSATRNRFHGNQPDWDLARAHDTGWQAWLNPGHPTWRDELAAQIEGLAARFGFDAVFLDTVHVWTNDPDYAVFDGLRALAERLRRRIPGVLLAAEHDYDALLGEFALFQRAYWGADPAWTNRYALRFGHLCEGEPEGRTGVHEFGVWQPGPVHAAPGLLATLAFQDDTLTRSRSEIESFLAGLPPSASPSTTRPTPADAGQKT